jgi:hypothetical protein
MVMRHLNVSLPSFTTVHQLLFTINGVYTKEVIIDTEWSAWQTKLPPSIRVQEFFLFLLDTSSSNITTCAPTILSAAKKEDILKALNIFIPSQYYDFWKRIIADDNSVFITPEHAPRDFDPITISLYINLLYPYLPKYTPILSISTLPNSDISQSPLSLSSITQLSLLALITTTTITTITTTTNHITSSNRITEILEHKCKAGAGVNDKINFFLSHYKFLFLFIPLTEFVRGGDDHYQ